MNLLAKYQNGNYTVKLYDDGTKIRYNDLDNLTPEFAESMDVTITTVCSGVPGYDNGNLCQYCYMGCTPNGKYADLNNPIFNTVHAGTEMAINGNDLSHPDLENFLIRMKDKGVIVNMTVNQKHLTPNLDKLIDWQTRKLIWGIGVSLVDSSDPKLIEALGKLTNAVLHVIDGCLSKQDLDNLSNHNIKMLVLGFKHKGRGIEYYNSHKEEIDNNIAFLRDHIQDYKQAFDGFGFDNLATEDLELRKLVGEEQWKLYHMGAEGEFSYFFDSCENKFAVSSMETTFYPALESFDAMFKEVRKMQGFS